MQTAFGLRINNALGIGSTEDTEFDYWTRPSACINAFLSNLGEEKTNYDTGWAIIDLEGIVEWTNCALENLDEVYEECSETNWDGYDAQPISREAYFEASKLLRTIPNSFPMPDILPEPDGGIGLEWYKSKGFSFVISVSGKKIITYAGRFGKNTQTCGTENFMDSIPQVILNGLKRLF